MRPNTSPSLKVYAELDVAKKALRFARNGQSFSPRTSVKLSAESPLCRPGGRGAWDAGKTLVTDYRFAGPGYATRKLVGWGAPDPLGSIGSRGMSGPQFMHIETYAVQVSRLRKEREVARAEGGKVMDRKLSVEEICGEAARLPGSCPHVDRPGAPALVFGVSPEQVPIMLSERIGAANAAIKAKKAAMARGTRASGPRAIRADTHTLLTMVTSYPIPWRDPETGGANFDNDENNTLLANWEKKNIAFAKAMATARGLELVSVVLHLDEAYPHLHFFFIPCHERMEARACHPGYCGRDALRQNEGEDSKAFNRRRNRAYIEAMREFQDAYYTQVGIDSGLLRTGPKRQRLTNGAYRQEKEAARARGLAAVRTEQLKHEVETKSREIEEANEVLASANDGAVKAILKVSELETSLHFVERDLGAKRAEADTPKNLERYREALIFEVEGAERALREAKEAVLEAEGRAAQLRAETDRQQAELHWGLLDLANQQALLDDERRHAAEEKRRHEREMQRRAEAVTNGERELAAVLEGVAAYGDGRLRIVPGSEPARLSVSGSLEDARPLVGRLEPVKPRLVLVLLQLDAALHRRSVAMSKAMHAAIRGWVSGVLQGVAGRGEDGRPTFHIPHGLAGDRLLQTIDPFREAVAEVIAALPDMAVIAALKHGISRLRPRLNAVEQAEVDAFDQNLHELRRHGGKGRE